MCVCVCCLDRSEPNFVCHKGGNTLVTTLQIRNI